MLGGKGFTNAAQALIILFSHHWKRKRKSGTVSTQTMRRYQKRFREMTKGLKVYSVVTP
jgi:hypothetical protein